MWKIEDKLAMSLIALPFILVIFIVAFVLLNASKPAVNNLQVNVLETQNIWFEVEKKNIKVGEDFDFNIFINTSKKELGAFAFDFNFLNENFTINIDKGDSGITKGSDAKNFMIMSNPNDVSSNHFRFSGICAKNCLQGGDKHLVVVHAKAKSGLLIPEIANWLEVKELSNTLGKTFDLNNYKGNIFIK